MADEDRAKTSPSVLLDASLAFCHELSERLTAATNYLAAYRKLASPEYRAAAPQLDEIFGRAVDQLALTGPLVRRYRQVLTAAAKEQTSQPAQAPVLVTKSDECDPPPAQGMFDTFGTGDKRTYRVCFLNRLARGDAAITGCRRSFVVCSAASADSAIDIARKRFAERYGIRNQQIGASIVEIETLD